MVDEILEDYPLCTICGSPLGNSSDDQPLWPTGPMCGECYQAREMDNEIWWTDFAGGPGGDGGEESGEEGEPW